MSGSHTGIAAKAVPTAAAPTTAVVEACRDGAQLREYIDTHWRKGHVLARDQRMFDFTYKTPWVDPAHFPAGISVLGIYESATAGSRMLGFLGAIVTNYPRPRSFWLALWHVLPELKGGGVGGKLLRRMEELALGADNSGWIGTFGAGPEALPVYLKRGYCVRAGRRWVFDPSRATGAMRAPKTPVLHGSESLPPGTWLDYRYNQHPSFRYDVRAGGVFRTEHNAWGVVTHCCRLNETGRSFDDAVEVYQQGRALAASVGKPFLMDAWAFECPGGPGENGQGEGTGWTAAGEELPSVFHPPEARGSLIYAVGKPFLPGFIHKGDCDQDRPN